MRAFLRDFLDRFAKAAVFANADNLGEALSLLEDRRRGEVARQEAQALRQAAARAMHRPAARRRHGAQLLAAN